MENLVRPEMETISNELDDVANAKFSSCVETTCMDTILTPQKKSIARQLDMDSLLRLRRVQEPMLFGISKERACLEKVLWIVFVALEFLGELLRQDRSGTNWPTVLKLAAAANRDGSKLSFASNTVR